MTQPENSVSSELGVRDLLDLEFQAREHGDDPLEAIAIAERGFEASIKAGEAINAAHFRARQAISYGHLADMHGGDPNYRISSKFAALASAEIARQSGDPASAIPILSAGRALAALGEHGQAVPLFEEALERLPQSESDNRPSVKADIRVHLDVSKYHAGDKDALSGALKAVEDLKSSDEDPYVKDVWVSGAYMKIAEAIYVDDSQRAREFLDDAQTIIEANPELAKRLMQLRNLREKLFPTV